MPLYRFIHRNPGDDSTYSFASNPDAERYEPVPEPKSSKSTPPAKADEVKE